MDSTACTTGKCGQPIVGKCFSIILEKRVSMHTSQEAHHFRPEFIQVSVATRRYYFLLPLDASPSQGYPQH